MKWLSPTSLIWIGVHLGLLLIGIICLMAAPANTNSVAAVILLGVGGSLVATGIAGEILYLYIKANENLSEQVRSYISSGLVSIFPYRSMQIRQEYERRVAVGKEIDIIGFGMSSLREDLGSHFVEWSKRAKVRILLLDPSFPTANHSYATQRDREEKNPEGQIARDVKAFLEFVGRLQGLDRSRFRIRLMKFAPSINLFRIDDEMFWGPYLVGDQSRNMPTMIVRRGGFLFERFQKHFSLIWDESKPDVGPDVPIP